MIPKLKRVGDDWPPVMTVCHLPRGREVYIGRYPNGDVLVGFQRHAKKKVLSQSATRMSKTTAQCVIVGLIKILERPLPKK